jgi:ABC-type transport system involved in multi-copper enzyme maturation permease subunit
MPVYDYSYKVWEGRRRGALLRWLAIPKFAYLELYKRWIVTAALTVIVVHLLVKLAHIYLFVNVQLLRLVPELGRLVPAIDAGYFKSAVNLQFFPCMLVAFFLGTGLISRDLRHNALVLYACKPISRWEYLAGKFSILFFVCFGIMGGITLLLFIVQSAVAPAHSDWSRSFWSKNARIGPTILLYAFVLSTTLSLLVLTASSLAKNALYAGITLFFFLFFTHFLAERLASFLNNDHYYAISPLINGAVLGDYLFRVENAFPGVAASSFPINMNLVWLSVVGYWTVCLLLLNWRIARSARYGR